MDSLDSSTQEDRIEANHIHTKNILYFFILSFVNIHLLLYLTDIITDAI